MASNVHRLRGGTLHIVWTEVRPGVLRAAQDADQSTSIPHSPSTFLPGLVDFACRASEFSESLSSKVFNLLVSKHSCGEP